MGAGASKTNAAKTAGVQVLHPDEVERRRKEKYGAKKRVMMARLSLARYEGYNVAKNHLTLKSMVEARAADGHSPYRSSTGYLETVPLEILDQMGAPEDNSRKTFQEALTALLVQEDEAAVMKSKTQLEMLVQGVNAEQYNVELNNGGAFKAPTVHSFAGWKAPEKGERPNNDKNYKKYYDKAVKSAKAGELCFQIFTAGVTEAFRTALRDAEQDERPMYILDPWDLTEAGVVLTDTPSFAIKGLQFGSRIMLMLAAALKKLAPGAQENTHIIIHLNSEVEQRVVEDILLHKFYGFKPDKVIFISQPRMPGFAWNDERQRLMAFNESNMRFYGTGYAMMQLTWDREGYRLTPKGTRKYITETVLAYVMGKGAKWISTAAVNDMYLYDDLLGIFDLDRIAYSMYLAENKGMGMTTEVDVTGVDSELCQTAVFAHPTLEGCGRVVHLEHIEPASNLMEAAEKANGEMNLMSGKSGYTHDLPVALRRMIIDLGALKKSLVGTPLPITVRLGENAIYPRLTAWDLALLPGMKCAMVSRGGSRGGVGEMANVIKPEQLSNAFVHVENQDNLPDFQNIARALKKKSIANATRPPNVKPRLEVAMSCDGTPMSYGVFDFLQTCVQPVTDQLHLLGFVKNTATQIDVGHMNEVLMTYEPALRGLDFAPKVSYMAPMIKSPAGALLRFSQVDNKRCGLIGLFDTEAEVDRPHLRGVLEASRTPVLIVKESFRTKILNAEKQFEEEAAETAPETPASPGRGVFSRSGSWSASKHVQIDQEPEDNHNKAVLQRKTWAVITKGRNAEMSNHAINLVGKLARDLDELLIIILTPDTRMPDELQELRRAKNVGSVEAKKGKWSGTHDKKGDADEEEFKRVEALKKKLMEEYRGKQKERLQTMREVSKMEQLAVKLKLKYRKEEVIALDFAEFLKTDTLDKFNVDVAVINGHPLDPEPAALSEEAMQFALDCPKPVMVFKGLKGEIKDAQSSKERRNTNVIKLDPIEK